MNNTTFVERVIELANEYDRATGRFYRLKPTSDYLSNQEKSTVDSFLVENPVFHFHVLAKALKETTTTPNNQVLAAYLQKKGFSKKRVVIPSSTPITLWSI